VPPVLDRLGEALGDRYRLARQLGAGGMALVFLADDLRHDRRVALKVLRPEIAAALGGERFLKEIHVIAKLQHPNILPLFDSGQVDGLLYYVMPFIEGETLREKLIRERQLPLAEAIRITADLGDALAYAHREGVIHRDIKPENVLLSGGRALVVDFGIALGVMEAGGDRLTETGMSLGTPEYMSPEQASGERTIDARTDLYSLACVTYEMLVGDPPFAGRSSRAVIARILTEQPSAIRPLRDTVPEAVEAAVLKALSRVPADRFATVEEYVRALERGRVKRTAGQRARRRRWRSGLLAVTGGLAVVVAAAFLVPRLVRRGPPPIGAGQTRRLTYAAGLELDPAPAPGGRLFAYVAGPAGRTRLFVQDLTGGNAIPLAADVPGQHRWPRWSPDGTTLAFLAFDEQGAGLYLVPALGGATRRLAQSAPLSEIHGIAWSPDGRRLAYTQRLEGVLTVAVEGGASTLLRREVDTHSPSWSPDGARLAYVSGNPTFVFGGFVLGNIAPSAIRVLPVEGGEPVTVAPPTSLNGSPVWTPDGRNLLFVSNRDGSRDVYQLPLDGQGRPRGVPIRLTTGLNAHTIALSPADGQLAYAVLQVSANVWAVDLPAAGSVSSAAARPVTTGNQAIEGMDVTRDGRWLAFDSDLQGNQDIYRMALLDGAPERLTTDPSDDFSPAWSADGRRIAFHSFRTGNRDVFVLDVDGGPAERATDWPSHERGPDWSPDGRLVLNSDRPGTSDLYVMARDPAGVWRESRRLETDGGAEPRWSPDGRWIAYLRAGSVMLMPAEGGAARTLVRADSAAGGTRAWAARWSPDSRSVFYQAFDAARRSSIWAVPVAGGPPRVVVRFDDPNVQSFRNVFATDGRRVYFTVGRHESDLWLMALEGVR
jgi:serine/threonine-protein kinase